MFANKNYELPVSSSAYTKLEQGDTKIRVLGSIYTGWEYFNTDNKPVRQEEPFDGMPEDARESQFPPYDKEYPKHFWAFKIWNYGTKRIELCSINKRGILNTFNQIVHSEEYGDPVGYDIKITREGEKKSTKYSIMALPPKPIGTEINDAHEEVSVNVEALFDGGNPFEVKNVVPSVDDEVTEF